jgi:hypothetical protein
MTRPVLMRVICLSVLLVVLGWAPDAAFAQRAAGHGGGGGGYHGGGYAGGVNGSWRGGPSSGSWGNSRSGWGWGSSGWRSSGWGSSGWRSSGWRTGGWSGCGWGGCGWGWSGCGWGWSGCGWSGCGWGGCGWGGWTFGFGFNWASPWPANPIVVAPAPVWVASFPITVSAAPSGGQSWNPPPDNQSSLNVQDNLPPAPASATVAPSVFYANSANMRYRSRVASQRAAPTTPATGYYLKASYTKESLPPLTPEAQNAVRALRAMPPYARAQQLSRYGSLSPQEVKVVRAAVGMPPT